MRSRPIALGGVTAALAVVIMCLGTLIPLATFVCPVLCMALLQILMKPLGIKNSWVWYGAVAILAVLMAPDKEAAFVFAFFGYYPLIRDVFQKHSILILGKLLYFNVSALVLYWLLIHVLGIAIKEQDFQELGTLITIVILVLGNVTFLLADRMLGIFKMKF